MRGHISSLSHFYFCPSILDCAIESSLLSEHRVAEKMDFIPKDVIILYQIEGCGVTIRMTQLQFGCVELKGHIPDRYIPQNECFSYLNIKS